MSLDPRWQARNRAVGLRLFALAISTLTVLGHLWLGFEQAWAHPLVAIATTYALELLFETVGARREGRRPRFLGSPMKLVDFLLSAHITGLAIAMLAYPGERLMPIVFACSVAIGSKALVRVRVGRGTRHVLNPSNFGLATLFLADPSVGLAPPYMFTEELGPVGDWVLPAIIVLAGTRLNARYTHRLVLIAAWLAGFALQAAARHLLLDASLQGALMPATGMGFLLFTFYMVSDPATTPATPRSQAVFGAAVAAGYGLLMAFHVVFGMFFSLATVCLLRGAWIALEALRSGHTAPRPADG